MDMFSSAKMMYTAVAMNEKQAAMKDQMSSMFRRGKRDKDKSLGGDTEDDDTEDIDDIAGFKPEDALRKGGSIVAAIATIGTNMFSLAAFGGPLHFLAGTVATGTATTVAYREVTMDDINSVRRAGNLLRNNVNDLAVQNLRLSSEIEQLQHQVFCLKETESRLKDLTGKQNLNIKNLVGLVERNKEILQERQKLVRQDVVADVVRVVLKADKDESGTFDKREIKRLIQYIENLPSVKVNQERLQAALGKNKSVASVIDLVNDLGRDDIPPQERIFTLDWENPKLQKLMNDKRESEIKIREEKRKSRMSQMSQMSASEDNKPKPLLPPETIAEFDEDVQRDLDFSEIQVETTKETSAAKKEHKSPPEEDEGETRSPKRSSKKKSAVLDDELKSPRSPKRSSKKKSVSDDASASSGKTPTRKSRKKASVSTDAIGDLESYLDAPKSQRKSKVKKKKDDDDTSVSELSTSKKVKKKKPKDDDDTSVSEVSTSKRVKKKKPKDDDDTSVSEMSAPKKVKKKKPKDDDDADASVSEMSASKKVKKKKKSELGDSMSSEFSTSKRKKKKASDSDSDSATKPRSSTAVSKSGALAKSDSARSLKSEKSTTSERPRLLNKNSTMEAASMNLGAAPKSPKSQRLPPSQKKKGLLGFANKSKELADKMKKKVMGDSDSD